MNGPSLQHHGGRIVVFHPSDSLSAQLRAWRCGRVDRRVETSLAESLPAIRKALRAAALVLLDAKDNPRRAREILAEAVERLGGYYVAVYTEETDVELELAVRQGGSLLLLGPMTRQQWEGFFEGAMRWVQSRRPTLPLGEKTPARHEEAAEYGGLAKTWVHGAARRTKTGVN